MNFLPGDFSFAPAPPGAAPPLSPPKPRAKRPWAAFWLLGLILLGCALAGALAPRDPGYLDLSHIGAPPSSEFWFGTDPMGRDLFSMIWHGDGCPSSWGASRPRYQPRSPCSTAASAESRPLRRMPR